MNLSAYRHPLPETPIHMNEQTIQTSSSKEARAAREGRHTRRSLLTAALLGVSIAGASAAEVAERVEPGEALALPDTAVGPAIDPALGFAVDEVADDVFVVTDGLYQAMFAVTEAGTVVFDAPPSLGERLLDAIAATTDTPVTHLVYSHSHIDHVGSANLFGDDVERVASAATQMKLFRFDDEGRPDADTVFARDHRLSVGGLPIDLVAGGSGHEPGNLFIHLPTRRVLMAVDLVFPGWVPFTNLGMAEDVGEFVEHHDELLAYDFDVFVGGHVGRAGSREDVEIAAEYAQDLVRLADEARGAVDFGAIAARTGYDNKWLLVKTYMDEVSDRCARQMLAKWGQRLGGADVSTPGHCWVTQEFLNINGMPSMK